VTVPIPKPATGERLDHTISRDRTPPLIASRPDE
jgi:hypothetical protein